MERAQAWTYEVLATDALRRRQMEAVERVCNVLSVEEDVAYALLKHCKWCEARTRSARAWPRRGSDADGSHGRDEGTGTR